MWQVAFFYECEQLEHDQDVNNFWYFFEEMKNFGLVKGRNIDLLKVVTDMSSFIAVCM